MCFLALPSFDEKPLDFQFRENAVFLAVSHLD